MRMIAGLGALLLVAACATPQEQCINTATRELRVMDRLIFDTRQNVARGYALTERTVTVPQWTNCERIVVGADGKRTVERYSCMRDTTHTLREPTAIDIAAETRKLDSMLARRARMAAEAERTIAACKASYPK